MNWFQRTHSRGLLLAMVWACTSGCPTATAPIVFAGTLTVDKAQYSFPASNTYYPVTLGYVFENRSNATVYIQNACGSEVSFQMLRPGSETGINGYNGRFCDLSSVLAPAVAVAAGGTYSSSISLHSLFDPNDPISNFTGTFQLSLRITETKDGKNLAPSSVRRSPPFVVVAQ